MTAHDPIDADHIEIQESWATSVTEEVERSRFRAWLIAGAFAMIAIIEAIAIAVMMPLKTVEPYTLLVDRQTGYVEALAPLDAKVITPDAALIRSFLVQYVIARESYDFNNLQTDYRKVGLWSAGSARELYLDDMRASNPTSPLSLYPRQTRIEAEVLSVSSLSDDSAMVRFLTRRIDSGNNVGPPQGFAAVINFVFVEADMTAEDRYLNPLGFQVTRYRSDPETLPIDLRLPIPGPEVNAQRDVVR